jgi:hypothetical protein
MFSTWLIERPSGSNGTPSPLLGSVPRPEDAYPSPNSPSRRIAFLARPAPPSPQSRRMFQNIYYDGGVEDDMDVDHTDASGSYAPSSPRRTSSACSTPNPQSRHASQIISASEMVNNMNVDYAGDSDGDDSGQNPLTESPDRQITSSSVSLSSPRSHQIIQNNDNNVIRIDNMGEEFRRHLTGLVDCYERTRLEVCEIDVNLCRLCRN